MNKLQPLRRGITAGVFLILLSSLLSAQNIQDTIIAYFNLMEQIPREKLYLQTDKPFYGAGEKIWFKGYLVDATTHQDNCQSNYIITELINRSDSVVERKKIRRDSLGIFQNAFTLPATLPAGDYCLRGYSNWMLNEEPEFLFFCNLKIGNLIDTDILSDIEYHQADETHYIARIRFTGNQKTFAQTNVRYSYIENGKTEDKGKKKTDDNGAISISLPDLRPTAKRSIEVEFDDPTYIYKRTFHLPTFSDDFDITFFPEGGSLLALPHQNVAFKAQGSDGLSKEVEGILLNQEGDTLTTFRTEHDGMGLLSLNPTDGETYHVIAKSDDGVSKQFNFPTVERKGIALSMSHLRHDIRYEVQKTDDTEWPKQMFLLAHTRGKLSVMQPITPTRKSGKMNDSLFTAGITHFLLIDGQGNTLSERLIFVPERDAHKWEIATDKHSYGSREKITLQISATDSGGAPVEGNFSISITDGKAIQPDSLADNIQSNLLLTSDLKGYVENPGFYFLNQDSRTLRLLDLLMMTHGWRRHQLTNALAPKALNITHYIEQGQTISGRIKGFFGQNVKKGPIHLLAPKQNIIATTTTDDKGEFIINTSFRDSTTFVVQARTPKGYAGVDIEIDRPAFPAPFVKTPFRDGRANLTDDYLINMRDQYYMEGGMPVYNLKEVVVIGHHTKKHSSESIFTGGINTYSIEEEQLKGYGQTALDAIRRLPSVTVTNGTEIHIRNNPQQPAIVIDDIVYENDDSILSMIQVSDMSSLSLLRGADANILGAKGAGGAIVITLKNGSEIPAKPARGVVTFTPLGYSDMVEFYCPTYDTPEKKNSRQSDLRSTIYWNPALLLDAEGKATVEYYTPDGIVPENIVIEGVDKQGRICRVTQTINDDK